MIVFVFHGHFWPRLLLLATSATTTNDKSYVCDLSFAFEQPLASRFAKREFAFAGGCGFFVSDVISGGHWWPTSPGPGHQPLNGSISLKFLLETRLQSES